MKYRKKPVVIEAMSTDDPTDVINWILETGRAHYLCGNSCCGGVEGIMIKTLEGDMLASPGDFVIKGVHGEFYPCKPDIFEATYEKVD